jgi:outer membrane lipoprotein SlyB
MNLLKFIPVFLILPTFFSCTQKSTLEIATGKVTTIKLGNVVRIKEINVLTSADDGTFANMAGTAEAMTPGIIGMGTSKLASATGSIVDGRVEATKMIRVRVKLKDTNELVEVQQEVTPNFTLKIGQEVVITQGSTPGNVWPD